MVANRKANRGADFGTDLEPALDQIKGGDGGVSDTAGQHASQAAEGVVLGAAKLAGVLGLGGGRSHDAAAGGLLGSGGVGGGAGEEVGHLSQVELVHDADLKERRRLNEAFQRKCSLISDKITSCGPCTRQLPSFDRRREALQLKKGLSEGRRPISIKVNRFVFSNLEFYRLA